jgi:2,4-dienoyl-CoA reductase-like NADH-dependent reductase (Old Yellow Enzyme family)
MFRPKEKKKHPLPVFESPTADDAKRSLLFSPLDLPSGLRLVDRTWVPAMVPWRATEEGFVTKEVLAWYERFAKGEPAALVVEATGVRDVPSGPLLRIGHDRFVPGLEELASRVRKASGGRTKLFIQIIDFLRIRRRPERTRFLRDFLRLVPEHRARLAEATGQADVDALSDAAFRENLVLVSDEVLSRVLSPRELEALNMGERERVTDVELAHIASLPSVLPGLFANAATRAKQAGFDGVELHFAHAYTMASFLSRTNTRTDGYGTTLDGRARLPIEVLRAVRSEVGAGFTVGARMLADEIIEGGTRAAEAGELAIRIAREGLDYLSLSTGGKFEDAAQPRVGEAAYPYTGESGYECMPTVHSDARGPFGRNVMKHAVVRRALRDAGLATPVAVAGGIGDFALAESILQRGEADIIAAARQSLADPDWWKKLREGRGTEVRRCIYTNYCEALDQRHKVVTCQQWDREALEEPGALLSSDGRRRLVAP